MSFLFRNRRGDDWNVEEAESDRLTTIGGYVMTHENNSRVKINAHLSGADKSRGRKTLLGWLFSKDIGTSGVDVWEP